MPKISFTVPVLKSVYYTEVSQYVFDVAVHVASEMTHSTITETHVEIEVRETREYLSDFPERVSDIQMNTFKMILDYILDEFPYIQDAKLCLENTGE